MTQASAEVSDVGFKLGSDCWGAEPAVQQPDGVGFLLQYLDDRVIDVAGAGELAQQLARLVSLAGAWARHWIGLARGKAETGAGVVRHAEAVGDPGESCQ